MPAVYIALRLRQVDVAEGPTISDSGAHPFALFGFDPLELWAQLKHFYQA